MKEELKKQIIKYSEKIRKISEHLMRKRKAEKILKELEDLERSIGEIRGNLSAEFIREDREG